MVRYMNGFRNLKTPVETGTSPEKNGQSLDCPLNISHLYVNVKYIYVLKSSG